LHQRDNPPHQSAAAPAQNSESTFPRIYPMTPSRPRHLRKTPILRFSESTP
jgi:hypothetical protein